MPFSLNAYLALTKGGQRTDMSGWLAPEGPVVWLHVTSPREARAMLGLCERLFQHIDDVHVVVTGLGHRLPEHGCSACVTAIPAPQETTADVEAFLSHWRPAICMWNGSALRPALILAAHKSGCRMALLLSSETPFSVPRFNWLGDIPASIMRVFSDVFCASPATLSRLRRLSLPNTQLHHAGPLVDGPLPPSADETRREAVATFLAGRPVWLAAQIQADEIDIVLRAHRRAGRYVHRLLLTVLPAPGLDVELIERALEDLSLRGAVWDGQSPLDEMLQVVIAPDPTSLGLWYRVAPVSFLGGSLIAGHGGTDPFAAVTLGSAVLYGPNVGNHLERYSQLVDAGAARIVKDMESLATAVNTVIVPDKSALMAHAGWELVTASAELADDLVEIMLEAVDSQALSQ